MIHLIIFIPYGYTLYMDWLYIIDPLSTVSWFFEINDHHILPITWQKKYFVSFITYIWMIRLVKTGENRDLINMHLCPHYLLACMCMMNDCLILLIRSFLNYMDPAGLFFRKQIWMNILAAEQYHCPYKYSFCQLHVSRFSKSHLGIIVLKCYGFAIS